MTKHIWKNTCSLLTWSKTPKSQKSQLYWSKTSKVSLSHCAPTNHCSGPVTGPLGTALIVWNVFNRYKSPCWSIALVPLVARDVFEHRLSVHPGSLSKNWPTCGTGMAAPFPRAAGSECPKAPESSGWEERWGAGDKKVEAVPHSQLWEEEACWLHTEGPPAIRWAEVYGAGGVRVARGAFGVYPGACAHHSTCARWEEAFFWEPF